MFHRSLETVIFTRGKSLVKSTLHRGACENKQFLPTLANCPWHANVRKMRPWSDTHIWEGSNLWGKNKKKNQRNTNGETGGDQLIWDPWDCFWQAVLATPGTPMLSKSHSYNLRLNIYPVENWILAIPNFQGNIFTLEYLWIYEHLKEVAFPQKLRSNGDHFSRLGPFQGDGERPEWHLRLGILLLTLYLTLSVFFT